MLLSALRAGWHRCRDRLLCKIASSSPLRSSVSSNSSHPPKGRAASFVPQERGAPECRPSPVVTSNSNSLLHPPDRSAAGSSHVASFAETVRIQSPCRTSCGHFGQELQSSFHTRLIAPLLCLLPSARPARLALSAFLSGSCPQAVCHVVKRAVPPTEADPSRQISIGSSSR